MKVLFYKVLKLLSVKFGKVLMFESLKVTNFKSLKVVWKKKTGTIIIISKAGGRLVWR